MVDTTLSADTNAAPSKRPISPPVSPTTDDLPLSPHLQIWRFTPTMAASITQRGTGVANFSGTLLLAVWAIAAALGEAWFAPVAGFLASPFGQLIVLGYIWSLCYHGLGGLRYLYTDTGRGLEKDVATKMAIWNFIGSFILTLIIAGAAFLARSNA
ncbi:MAG: succinate dehydrogenase, cytochrome b556 subunit [Pseudomonadota bacterium]